MRFTQRRKIKFLNKKKETITSSEHNIASLYGSYFWGGIEDLGH